MVFYLFINREIEISIYLELTLQVKRDLEHLYLRTFLCLHLFHVKPFFNNRLLHINLMYVNILVPFMKQAADFWPKLNSGPQYLNTLLMWVTAFFSQPYIDTRDK